MLSTPLLARAFCAMADTAAITASASSLCRQLLPTTTTGYLASAKTCEDTSRQRTLERVRQQCLMLTFHYITERIRLLPWKTDGFLMQFLQESWQSPQDAHMCNLSQLPFLPEPLATHCEASCKKKEINKTHQNLQLELFLIIELDNLCLRSFQLC